MFHRCGWVVSFIILGVLRLWGTTLPFDPDYVVQGIVATPARVSGNAVLGLLTNPAELAKAHQHGMWFMASSPLEDTQLIQLHYLLPTTLGALGVGLTHWSVNNIPETVMLPRPIQISSVTNRITSFRLGFSSAFLADTVLAGVTARYGMQNLAGREAVLTSLDIGAIWHPLRPVSLGVTLKNGAGSGWNWADSHVQEDLVSDIVVNGTWDFQLGLVGAEVTRFQNSVFTVVPLGFFANVFGAWQSAGYGGSAAAFGVQFRLMDMQLLYQMTVPVTEGFDISHQFGLSMNFGSPLQIQLPKINWRRDPFPALKMPAAAPQPPNTDSGELTAAESRQVGVVMITPLTPIYKAIQADITQSEANWHFVAPELLQTRMTAHGWQPADLGNKDDAVVLADETRCGLLILAEVLPNQSDFRYQFRVYDAVMEKWYTAKITLPQNDMPGFHTWFRRLLDAILKKRG